MEMILGLVADAANKGEGNKLNVLGIFHRIETPVVPSVIAQMAIALEFKIAPHEKGQTFQIHIQLHDPDGVKLFAVPITMGVKEDPKTLEPIAPISLILRNVAFPKFGNYRFEVLVDSQHIDVIPFEVARLESAAPGAN